MVSFVDLVIAARPHCADPLRASVGDYLGGTIEHWRCVYRRCVDDLRGHLKPPPREGLWPSDWFACSEDSYYECYGHHRNPWRQFDAVIVQLQRRAQIIVEDYGLDMLDMQQGIGTWRQLMKLIVIDLDCFSCGSSYQKRDAIIGSDRNPAECECPLCIEMMATHHKQMLADYLHSISPSPREIGQHLCIVKRPRGEDLGQSTQTEKRRRRRM